MKRKRLILIAIAVVVMGSGAVFVVKGRAKKEDDSGPRLEVVKNGPLRVKIRETGRLEALISVNVKSNVEGVISTIFVREGDTVEAGDPLIQLDDERIAEEQKQVDANLGSSKAQVEQARRNVELTGLRQDALLESAGDSVAMARAGLEAASRATVQQVTAAELEIANTETALQQDLISLNQARIAQTQDEISLERARSRQESTTVSLANAETELRRMQALRAKGFVSAASVEAAQSAHANAKTARELAGNDVAAQLESAKSHEEGITSREAAIENRREVLAFRKTNLDEIIAARSAVEQQSQLQLQTAQTELGRATESIEAEKQNSESSLTIAGANYVRAESSSKNAQERLDWTRIVAPMSGTVIALVVEEGEIVQSGRSAFSQGPAIMTIADLSQMVIKTYINEVDIPKIAVDQRVEINSDAYQGRIFEGRVKEISPRAVPIDNVTKFEIEVEVLGSPAELRPGMHVDVDVIVADETAVAVLPIETLIEKQKLTVSAALPAGGIGGLSRNQKVSVESRSGKKYGGRIMSLDGDGEYPVVIFIDEGAPKGLRVGEQTLHIVPEGAEGEDVAEEDKPKKIEDVRVKIESERKQLVLLQDKPDDDGEEQKEGFLSKLPFVGGKKDGKGGGDGVERQIKVGLRNDTAFEVESGLNLGDEVLIPDLSRLVSN